MKKILVILLLFAPFFLLAQYPTGSNKSRLGWQTTGDGLIWRGVAGDTVNKPNNRNYPYFQLDTVNSVLYRYIQTRGQWQPTSIDIDSLSYATRYWVSSNFFPLQGGTLTGTGGNGFVGFPLQSSPPVTPATGFSLYAGSTGNNISWMQPDGFFRRLVSPVTSTPRQYQFMARSYTLGDSADIANNVTSIAANYIATSNGANLVARNLFDNNTYVGVLNSKPFSLGQWTTAGRPSGTSSYMGWNTTLTGVDWYNGTRWATGLESTFARGTSTYIPFFDANGQVTQDGSIIYNNSTGVQTISKNVNGSTGFYSRNTSTGSSANGSYVAENNTGLLASYGVSGSSYSALAFIGANSTFLFSNATNGVAYVSQFGGFRFATGSPGTERLRIDASGNMGLGGSPTLADFEIIRADNNPAAIRVINTNTGTSVYSVISFLASPTTTRIFTLGRAGDSAPTTSIINARDSYLQSEDGDLAILTTNATGKIKFTTTGSSIAKMTLGTDGFLSIGNITATQELDVNGDAYIRDSTRLTTTPAHSSITGLLTRDANGWVGLGALGSGLSYSGGVLTATGASTWLKTELEASRDVDITGGSSTDFRIRNTRTQFDNTFKVGSDSSFIHNPNVDTTYAKGVFATDYMRSNSSSLYSTVGGIVSQKTTYGAAQGAYYFMSSKSSSGWLGGYYLSNNLGTGLNFEASFEIYRNASRERYVAQQYILDPYTLYTENYLSASLDTAIVAPANWLFIRMGNKTNTIPKSLWFTSAGATTVDTAQFRFNNVNGSLFSNGKFFTVENAGSPYFVIRTTGTVSFNTYGLGNKEATDISKTQSNYIAGFATDGTVLDLERKRDTTIYIDDADYDWSAAITTAQIASRFNRVIFWMTTTAAAGSDSELTLHTPDANLLQVEYLIHSVDEPAGFDNKIVFGTNNAVDSTNGLVTNYFPAAGDGIHIRAGLRSGVYKYRYSN